MSKFKVFDINKIIKARIGVFTYNLTDLKSKFFRTYANYYVLFFIISGFIISSSIFAYRNASDFIIAMRMCLVVLAGLQCLGMLLSIGLNKTRANELQNILQEIVDEGKAIQLNCQIIY